MKVMTVALQFFDPSALHASCSNSSSTARRVLSSKTCPRNTNHCTIRYGSASQNLQWTRERSNLMTWSIIDDNRAAGNVAAPAVKRADDAPIVSPFEQKKGGLYSADVYDLNAENVDLVLNDVRPYLISDGGDVEVVSVDDGVVSLRLQGACGSCPSSTTTMKMGIERVLGEKFGESLKGVVQVDEQQIGATLMGVDSLLETLRGAIHNYGGFVEVVSVSPDEGRAEIKFKGPAPIGVGIQEAIKDKFPDIREVVLV